MTIHPDKTAERAVDACGGAYTPEQKASGYADGHFEALDAAMMAVRPADALMADLLEALTEMADAVEPLVATPTVVGPITQRARDALTIARAALAKAVSQ